MNARTITPRRLAGSGALFVVLLMLHGIAHFAGVVPTLRRIDHGESAELFAGKVSVSSPNGIRLIAFTWALLGVAIIVAAVLVMLRHPSARTAVLLAAGASLVFSIAGLWPAVLGVVLNLFVLAVARRDSASVFAHRGDALLVVDPDSVKRFLAQRRVAVVGASSEPKKFGNAVYRELRAHGYDTVPVNPNAAEVEGDACYPNLARVPGDLDAVMVMVPGAAAVAAVHESAARGVRHVWLFRGLGSEGAMSQEALTACYAHDLDVVAGACPLMFLDGAPVFHRAHFAVRRFNGAIADAA